MKTQTSMLDYGQRPRRNPFTVRRLGIAMAILAVAIPAIWWGYDRMYYADLRRIRAELSTYPVTIQSMDGMDDVTLENITADVVCTGGMKTRIRFLGLEEADFQTRSKNLWLSDLGSFTFTTEEVVRSSATGSSSVKESKRMISTGNYIDLQEPALNSRFPFPLNTPGDVIKHADGIVSAMSSWPNPVDFVNAKGLDCRVTVHGIG